MAAVHSRLSRRSLVEAVASIPFSQALARAAAQETPWKPGPGMPEESARTPKLCAPVNLRALDDAAMRRIRQIGVTHVLSSGPSMPWQAGELQALIARLKQRGLTLGNLMISGFTNILYGRPGRDEEIEKVKQSIRAAGTAGIPVVEYNFYAHRAIEGYYEETGRGGSGLTAFDADRLKDLAPPPQEGTHTLDEMWSNIGYFLKAVIPVAEASNVRLALHPNDPPVALSRGSGQIMATVEGWKYLIGIVNSPANGITFDCGVTREMGHDPVEVCHYFGKRDRINHVHYRNVRVRQPYNQYTEVFIDEGENDMFAVMRELVAVGYTHLIYPEHERALDVDRERGLRNPYPGGGGYTGMVYDIAYARAMLQAALSLRS